MATLMTHVQDYAHGLPLKPTVPTAHPNESTMEKLARLEAENAALKERATAAEKGWRDVLLERNPYEERPEQRNAQEVLVSLAQLAEEQLAETKKLVARASTGESRSSASVKDSTRGVDLEVKSYGDGLLDDALTDAIEAYRRGRLKLAELQANQWRDTVSGLVEAAAHD